MTIHRRKLWAGTFGLVILTTALSASALIMVGFGNKPVQDNGWPAGSVELANLKARAGWWEGPPFGGGQYNFLYRGDVQALQQSLDLFSKIKAPKLQLFVHDGGPAHTSFLKDPSDPKSDDRYDWSFTVWNPQSWNHLYNSPGSYFSAQDPNDGFRREVEGPRMDLFIGKGGIDFSQVKVPNGVQVTDERADANGFRDGSAVVGDAYDMTTSKPIAGAVVTIESSDNNGKQSVLRSGTADAAGHFVVRAIPNGSDRICVAANGCAPRLLGYVEFRGNTFKRFTTQLAPAARLRGTVADSSGKPVPRAVVRADGIIGPNGHGYVMPASVSSETDDKGVFELSGLPQGHVQLFASASGYAMLDVLKLQSIPDDHVAIRMTATGTVKVRVLMSNGKPATRGNVSIDTPDRALGSWGGSADTKPDGTFTFEGVPPGTYIISAMSTNPGPAPSPRDQKKTITLAAGQTIEVDITGR